MIELTAKNLVKHYSGRAVVDGISISLKQGEIVGLLGPNGAGKTTSFYMIAGLIPVDDGSITLGNEDITADAMHIRAQKGIGYLAQESSIFRRLSVIDNILAILELRDDLTASEQHERADDLLKSLNISHLAENTSISLSGGERRRLEIARALASEPKFILLDEPFAGVDPISVVDIQKIIKSLANHGIGILITDHNVRETLSICHHAYIVNEGKILAEGEPDALLEDKHVRKIYLGEDFKI